jgi:hypothetical protein
MSDMIEKFDCWANVEVMGHRRFAGKVTEQVVAGCGFVRIDVPQVDDRMPFTKLIGTASIYAITPCSELVAMQLARQYREKPVEIYSPSVQPALQFADDKYPSERDYLNDDGDEDY